MLSLRTHRHFLQPRMMVCHVCCDKPRNFADDTRCEADSLHEPSSLALLLRGHPLFEPHISLPRESVSTFIGDQLLSSSNHAEPLPFHVSQTASVTNSHKETSKYTEAPLCCTTPSCSHNVRAFSDRLELTGLVHRTLKAKWIGEVSGTHCWSSDDLACFHFLKDMQFL
jgi:hypothetical protein